MLEKKKSLERRLIVCATESATTGGGCRIPWIVVGGRCLIAAASETTLVEVVAGLALVSSKTALVPLLSAEATGVLVESALTATLVSTLVAAEAALTATLISAEAALATTTCITGDFCLCVLQGWADLVDLNLEDGALLALAGFVGALTETALHDDAHALRQ